MKRFLTDNLIWKVFSVLVAFALWIAVAREPELATSISVPILFRNIPDDLDIASDVPERVHLEVRGPSGRLTPANLALAAVVLDLATLQPGQRTFTIQESDIRKLPIGVLFYRAVPSQVSLRFEHLVSKSVPIEPAYAKAPPDGYIVTSYSFSPPKVRLRGPESHVQNIDLVTTDPIDLSGVVSHAEMRVNIRTGDPQVRLESDSVVKFFVELQKLSAKERN